MQGGSWGEDGWGEHWEGSGAQGVNEYKAPPMIACGVHVMGPAARDTQWEIGRHSEDNNGPLWPAEEPGLFECIASALKENISSTRGLESFLQIV